MHLTDLAIQRLRVDAGQKDFTDDDIPGLTLRVGKRAKTFMLLVGSGESRERIKLGRYDPPRFTLSMARSRAKEIIGERQKAKTSTHKTPTQDALDRFREQYAEKNKPSTVEETFRLLNRYLPLTGHLNDLTRRQMVQILDGIDALSERRHFYTAAHTFFRWSRRYDVPNVLEGVEKPAKAPRRSRLLTDEEIAFVWQKSLLLGSYGRLCRVLIASGQRAKQIAHLHSDHLDRSQRVIVWPWELMKGNREFLLPYGEVLNAQLPQGRGLLFANEKGRPWNSWSDPHDELLELTGLPHFTRHDFRRYYSSTHSAIGTPPHIRELLLSHAIGSEVSRTYDCYTYLSEKRAAQQAFEQHLSKLIAA
jgi:integrase